MSVAGRLDFTPARSAISNSVQQARSAAIATKEFLREVDALNAPRVGFITPSRRFQRIRLAFTRTISSTERTQRPTAPLPADQDLRRGCARPAREHREGVRRLGNGGSVSSPELSLLSGGFDTGRLRGRPARRPSCRSEGRPTLKSFRLNLF